MIPLLGAFAAGFIVIFPGLCLLEVALTRQEQNTLSKSKEDAEEEDVQRRLASIQTDQDAPMVVAVKSGSNWKDSALVGSALSLLVFGAFMLGIIVTNSFMNLNPKPPLCV